MTSSEQQIERRVILEAIAECVPVVAELIAEHTAAVEACRRAADALRGYSLDTDNTYGEADDLRRAIDAVRGIAERYA